MTELWKSARQAAERGELAEALGFLEKARAIAEQSGDEALAQSATVRWAGVAVELEDRRALLETLRPLCERALEPRTGFLATYQAARAFELEKEFKKALYYARLAVERSGDLDATSRAAASNLLGNVLLAESHENEAIRAYESALASMPEQDEIKRSRILDNLGYCRALQGRHEEAIELLHSALRLQLRHRAWHYSVSTHIDLCYLHLELERPRWARRHGERALELAREAQDGDAVRNALYLLGQAYTALGLLQTALETAEALEREFFADTPGAARLLLAVDSRQLVNLRA